MRAYRRLAAAFALCAPLQPAIAADIYALSVGINEYDHERALRGAVADALDIRKAAVAMGAKRAKVLLDRQATREQIEAEFNAMVNDAQKGDTLIFSYAGHGAQEEDVAPFDESDGRDEAFLLSAFDRNSPSAKNSNRLLDDDVYKWLQDAGAKGLKVMFVADSCFSGTMTRTVSADDRSAPNPSLPPVNTSAPSRPDAGEDSLAHVTFFSATQESRVAPEITINGEKRGALSYAFARGIEGEADIDGNKTLTRSELGRYVRRSVRQLSEAIQTAEIRYRSGSDDDAVFGGQTPFKPQDAITGIAKLKLYLTDASAEQKQNIEAKLRNAVLVDQKPEADLLWNAKDRGVISGGGDPVAYGIDAIGLQTVIDKWIALAYIKQLVIAKPLDTLIAEGDGFHRQGTNINVVTLPVPYTNLTLFNLAPGGEVQFLYPKPYDKKQWPVRTPYTLPIAVKDPPFGAEHLIILSTPTPLPDLHEKLQSAAAADVPLILAKALAGVEHQIGLQMIYTVSRGPRL